MESYKMLGLSTAHITKETADALIDLDGITSYEKADYGWFVHVPERFDLETSGSEVPEDLFKCLDFAIERDYAWIMFDNDIEATNELPVYKWD